MTRMALLTLLYAVVVSMLHGFAHVNAHAPHAPVFLPSTDLFRRHGPSANANSSHLSGDGAYYPDGRITLVESLPVGDFDLNSSVPSTFDALLTRIQRANTSIDVSAMYWYVCCCLSLSF